MADKTTPIALGVLIIETEWTCPVCDYVNTEDGDDVEVLTTCWACGTEVWISDFSGAQLP